MATGTRSSRSPSRDASNSNEKRDKVRKNSKTSNSSRDFFASQTLLDYLEQPVLAGTRRFRKARFDRPSFNEMVVKDVKNTA
mmetsp:Transcript_4294/g.5329  ORF Transcript_4294/g.5329 Transcript_4294/m.5329 type:complete len:82 (+) Transcript_4294:149-394(+)